MAGMGRRPDVTQYELDLIVKLRRLGESYNVIGKTLGRSRNSIGGIISRYNLHEAIGSKKKPRDPSPPAIRPPMERGKYLRQKLPTNKAVTAKDAQSNLNQFDPELKNYHQPQTEVDIPQGLECKWPLEGDSRGGDLVWCCAPVDKARHSSYCAFHADLGGAGFPVRRKDIKPIR